MVKILAIIFFVCVGTYVLFRDTPGFASYEEAGGPFLGASFGQAFQNTIQVLYSSLISLGHGRCLLFVWRN
jgi:L-asparagine transporter-like permease